MTPHGNWILILSKKGSLTEVSKEVGKSRAYVSIMRKIARDATATLLNAWGDNLMPFDLVRLVIVKDKRTQMSIVQEYIETTKGRNKEARGGARAVLLARLRDG